MKRTKKQTTTALGALFLSATLSQGAVLWSIEGKGAEAGTNYDINNASTTTTVLTGVDGPDGDAFGSGVVGYDTDGSAKARVRGAYGTTSPNKYHFQFDEGEPQTKTIDFDDDYIQWTVSAEAGYQLNLTSLDFQSARGGTGGTRGFEIYGLVGGTPTIGDLLKDVDNDSGTRETPTAQSIDLSDAGFQGINSITFRYYALATEGTMEFNEMSLSGTVTTVPEPSSTALIGLGGLALILRRRR